MDGALVANKIINWAKKSKREVVLMKLDFHKAYDTISWDFIDQVLELMCFGIKWRQWTKSCITTASISILINGSPTTPFKMERGLRQGDPLSPFLFLLAAEMFNVLMNQAVRLGIFEGIKVGGGGGGCGGGGGGSISHLSFTDDKLVFCAAKTK